MRLVKVTLISVFLCAVSLSAQTLDEIIARNFQAHGGIAKAKAIKSVRITGNFDAGGIQGKFTQVFKRPSNIRLDATIQGVTITQAYDGQSGWQIIPFTGQNTPAAMSGDDLKQIQEEADFDGPLMDYKQKGIAVQLIGKEKVDGADAYHLHVTLKNGDVRDLYLDATTFLMSKMVGKIVAQGTPTTRETKVSDYRDVEGVKFPFSSAQQSLDGLIPDQKVTIEKIELNVPVEDSLFKMPAPTPAPAPAAEQPKKPALR